MRYYLSTERRKSTLSDWPTMIVTFTLCLLCWVLGYYYSVGFPLTANDAILPLWERLCEWPVHRVIVYIFGLLLMVLVAYVMQRISDIEMLFREKTRLVFLFFFFLTSTNAGLLPFSEISIVLLCLVFMIYELFKTYQLPDATGKLFNAGALIGLAGLFMPQILWLIPLLWLGMYQFQSLSYRSFMASLIGVLLNYWFVLAWCVWTHDYFIFVSFYNSLTNFDFFSIFLSFKYFHVGFIVIAILLFVAFFYIKMDAINNRVRVRQMLSFLINMSIWLFVLLCMYGRDADLFLAVLYLPVSVLMAYFFERMRYHLRFFFFYFVLMLSVFSFITRIWSF